MADGSCSRRACARAISCLRTSAGCFDRPDRPPTGGHCGDGDGQCGLGRLAGRELAHMAGDLFARSRAAARQLDLVGASPIVTDANPVYQGETGKRRGGWNAFFDDPTAHPEGTRHVTGTFKLRGARAKSVGDRVELVFDGMRMGSFEGAIAYTFYPGSRLIQQEAVLTTNEPDVAYYYDAGLDMSAPAYRTAGNNMNSEAAYYDTNGALQRVMHNGLQAEREPVKVRYRTLAAQMTGGSIAVFPAPHQYFFPRDFSSNLGVLGTARGAGAWPRHQAASRRELAVLPVDQRAAGTRPADERLLPCLRVPHRRARSPTCSATPTAIASARSTATRRSARTGTWRTPSRQWPTRRAWTPPFKPVLKAMGVDASMIMDFHGDGRPGRPHGSAPRRAARLLRCAPGAVESGLPVDSRRGSQRAPRRTLDAGVSEAGLLGHGSAEERRVRRAAPQIRHGLQRRRRQGNARPRAPRGRLHVQETHPRTKGSTGYPDKILATDYFRDASLPWRRMEGAALGSVIAPPWRSRLRSRRRV